MEQYEIEFAPRRLPEMAATIAISKWVVRNICMRHGVAVSFVPKMSLVHAGTGMHIHICGLRNGKNVVANRDGGLSDEALTMIGGILNFAPSLAAFGNPTPISYLRFVARKESPMHICWSTRNRLALIRIPLWWSFRKGDEGTGSCRETFEYRAPDAFANPYLLFAGLALAANYGLKNSAEARKIADDLHVETTPDERKKLRVLPCSCDASANSLDGDRQLYEEDEVFPRKLVDKTVEKLKSYKDRNLFGELTNKPEVFGRILTQYLDYG
jgi:glutamine synthetase